MDPEIKSLLEENINLSKNNNELLVKLHRVQKLTLVSRIIYWVLLILIALGAFYFIKPFFNSISEFYNFSTMNSLNNLID